MPKEEDMGGVDREIAAYDVEPDVERFSKYMKEWAAIGFMRGFSGARAEVLPKGKMNLPSAAFQEAAMATLDSGNPDEAETGRRLEYIEAVEARLRQIQGEAINAHFTKAAWGQLADAATAAAVLAAIFGLLCTFGPLHPLALFLILLLALKLFFMHWFVRRMIRVAQAAFQSKTEDFELPWLRS